MLTQVPIVVVAYNRPKALERLLASLLNADYPGKVELVISVDKEEGKGGRGEEVKGGRGEEVRRIAEVFEWPFGEKKLIFHDHNLGLRKHVLACGDLSKDYDAIIVLEDDLLVAPGFYQYALQANDFYKDDPKIAGVSLYAHAYNETAQFPFLPLSDDSDVFFFQYASSWGQLWTHEGWRKFRNWYDTNENLPKNGLPPNIKLWPENSWKKFFISFIIQHDLYFVYPRYSLTTIFSDKGTNIRIRETFLQVPLWMDKKDFRFIKTEDSNAVYDVFGEILPDRLKRLCPDLNGFDFDIDLYGMKSTGHIKSGMLLSSRKCTLPLKSFGREMRPHEMNVAMKVEGDHFSFGKTEDFKDDYYFVRLLKCHEKKELAYWYPIREYHFYRNRLISTNNSSIFWLNPFFLFKKGLVTLQYAYRYFVKK